MKLVVAVRSVFKKLLTVAVAFRSAHGFAVCEEHKVLFYHAPKCAGSSLNAALRELGCTVYADMLKGGVYGREKQDRMHVTPGELDLYAHRHVVEGETLALLDTEALQSTPWRLFAFVRNPYLRVLSAFDQRMKPFYDRSWPCADPSSSAAAKGGGGGGGPVVVEPCGHSPHPREFVAFMRWLDSGLRSGELTWCCDPTITHFRPATRFSHWPNGAQAVTLYGKLETFDADLRNISEALFGRADSVKILHKNSRNNGEGRSSGGLCGRATGCETADIPKLLVTTQHTRETLAIVNRWYQRDFQWLGYNLLKFEGSSVT